MSSAEPTSDQVTRSDQLAPAEIADVLGPRQRRRRHRRRRPARRARPAAAARRGDAPAVHLIARDDDGTLTGYAHLDTTDPVGGLGVELVVHPAYRRRGTGRALARGVLARPPAAAAGVGARRPPARPRALARRPRLRPRPGALAVAPAAGRPAAASRACPTGWRCARSGPGRTTRPGWRSTRAPSPSTPSRAGGRSDDLRRPAAPSRGSTRPASCSPSRPPTGPAARLPLDQGARAAAGRPGSARCTSWGWSPDAHGGGLGRALTTAGLALPAGQARPRPGDALRRRVEHRAPSRSIERLGLRPLVRARQLPPGLTAAAGSAGTGG